MKRILSIMLTCCLILTGCGLGNDKEGSYDTDEAVVVSNYEPQTYKYTYKSPSLTVYAYGDTIPLISDGKVMAFIKINQITKLNIQDWSNKDAVKNSIKHSYAINITIRPTENLEQDGDCVIDMYPYLVTKKGKVIGKPAYVGWSGFPEAAEFLNGVEEVTIEKAFQPMTAKESNSRIKLEFSSSSGISFDDIYIGSKALNKAKSGNSVHNASETLKITSVSGAKYSLKFSNLEYDSILDDYSNNVIGLCFNEKIKYLTKPSKKAKVLRFDSKKGYMYTNQDMRIQTDSTAESLSNRLTYPQRHLYVNSEEYEYFSTEMKEVVAFGKSDRSLQVWELPNTATNPKYVRFYLEFPEESQALHSVEEILNLKTRYIVVQGKVKKHVLPSYAEYISEKGVE